MQQLEELNITSWDESISKTTQLQAIQSLEAGRILYMPALSFPIFPYEKFFLAPHHVDPKRKNISYDLRSDHVGGTLVVAEDKEKLKEMLKRYALTSGSFLCRLFPHYTANLSHGKTSFRPTEIFGRKSSVHKDDTRLHIDAFPSNPTKGRRILRMFTNINPQGKPRVWKVGEPFEEVVKKFSCKVPKRIPGSAHLMHFFKLTKERRTEYDHFMLHMHNQMKADNLYQNTVTQAEILFPPGSSWIVFTDQVSHAALAGQHVFEQTFSLPATGLKVPETAPHKILEKFLNRSLALK